LTGRRRRHRSLYRAADRSRAGRSPGICRRLDPRRRRGRPLGGVSPLYAHLLESGGFADLLDGADLARRLSAGAGPGVRPAIGNRRAVGPLPDCGRSPRPHGVETRGDRYSRPDRDDRRADDSSGRAERAARRALERRSSRPPLDALGRPFRDPDQRPVRHGRSRRVRPQMAERASSYAHAGRAPHFETNQWREYLRGLATSLRAWLPQGGSLPNAEWQRRHAGIMALLWFNVLAVPAFALAVGRLSALHDLESGLALGVMAAIAASQRMSRKLRMATSSLALLSAVALVVHAS